MNDLINILAKLLNTLLSRNIVGKNSIGKQGEKSGHALGKKRAKGCRKG